MTPKIYFLAGLTLMASIPAMAQSNHAVSDAGAIMVPHRATEMATEENNSFLRGNDFEVFFTEDFSNGLAGMDDNGAWTVGGPQGNLWFQTFPMGTPNGYNPDELNGDYTTVPNWFGSGTTINSPTASNGFMMLDADAFNSTSVPGTEGNTTSNAIEAYLISPTFDLNSAASGTLFALEFSQKFRLCCTYADLNLYVDYSTDNGATWSEAWHYIYNETPVDGTFAETTLSTIPELSADDDLSQVKLRFRWPSGGLTHYYWMIDDVSIIAYPDNDLEVTNTYYNNYIQLYEDGTDAEYINAFEYSHMPNYTTRPFNFGAVVWNNGPATQTGVTLHVTFNPADGPSEMFSSDEYVMESGDSLYISIDNVVPDAWTEYPEEGTYTFDFEVTQNEQDFFEYNNVGDSKSMVVTADPNAVFQNGVPGSTLTADDYGADKIWGTRYVFSEDEADSIVITHVEFALWGTESNQSIGGNVVYTNVRIGSVFDDAETTVAFEGDDQGSVSYGGSDTEILFLDEDLSPSANEVNWISRELSTPVMIDPGIIYQAELRVPDANGPYAFPMRSITGETASSVVYVPDDEEWFYTGERSVLLRFRTMRFEAVGIDKISVEKDLKVVQNYPNPFVDKTTIQYRLDRASNVALQIHDITGKVVKTMDLGVKPNGTYTVEVNRDGLKAGVYTYTFITETTQITRKMTVQ